ncbi:uncharacterized protein METZ01_LOCUS127243 [marine metagenome]|uniref:Uncharacterized protein n=1 Tax=marine metagenome TaxID=408172 RepID=A0A381YBD0_9ZZZZ
MANPLPENCSNRSCIRGHIMATTNKWNNTPGSQVSLVTLVAGPKALGTVLAMYLRPLMAARNL